LVLTPVALALTPWEAMCGPRAPAWDMSESLASTRRLSILLVRGEVEQDEENEVGAEDTNTSEGSKLLSGTLARVGHPGEICRGEVRAVWAIVLLSQ